MAGTKKAPELQSLRYERGSLQILDQLKLPHETKYVDVLNAEDAFHAIKSMMVRGAPLIAMVAMLGLAVDGSVKRSVEGATAEEVVAAFSTKLDYLRTSRPTAVNLAHACDDMKAIITKKAAEEGSTGGSVVEAFVVAAEAMLEEDVAANRRQGDYAVEFLLSEPSCQGKERLSLLTHCNTGSLATAGFGTALGVIRALSGKGLLEACFCTETRPYNQGARLTAYEFVSEELPGTLIPDTAAAALLAQGKVDAIVVGADRVAANGDTANKIGTLQLAIVAAHYGVPFLVVCPLTSCDDKISSGADIVIEERPAGEFKSVAGVKVAPDAINVWNPAFDVTPANLITAIVTDRGVIRPEGDGKKATKVFDVRGFKEAALEQETPGAEVVGVMEKPPEGYYALTGDRKVAEYLTKLPRVMEILGASNAAEIESEEFGDGNLNLVFRCKGPGEKGGTVIVKQALPYVRCIGESWPLTLDRAYFEGQALLAAFERCRDHSPEVYHTDRTMATIVMRYIEPPHTILRHGLIKGLRYSTLGRDMGTYLGRTLFLSSGLHLSGAELHQAVGRWSANYPMCELTEQVVFTDPYAGAPINRWTSPELDEIARSIQEDLELRLCASRMKDKFMQSTEALIHADLHTGSVMAMEGSTQVIDPEFAFYGPMGFDVGAYVGNLLLAYCAVPGNGQGEAYGDWLLDEVSAVWQHFKSTFLELWSDKALHAGESYKRTVYPEGKDLQQAQTRYMERLWKDSMGFGGMKMIRRVVGVSHVEDLESIPDRAVKVACEKHAIALGRRLVLSSRPDDGNLSSVADLCALAKSLRE